MRFLLTSISRKVLDLPEIASVVLPTRDGEVGFLPDHMPLITVLTPGVLTVRFADGTSSSYAIGGGVAETDGKTLTVAADMVEDGTALDLETIRAKKAEAQKLLQEYQSSHETVDMEKALDLEYELLKESAKEQLATAK